MIRRWRRIFAERALRREGLALNRLLIARGDPAHSWEEHLGVAEAAERKDRKVAGLQRKVSALAA